MNSDLLLKWNGFIPFCIYLFTFFDTWTLSTDLSKRRLFAATPLYFFCVSLDESKALTLPGQRDTTPILHMKYILCFLFNLPFLTG